MRRLAEQYAGFFFDSARGGFLADFIAELARYRKGFVRCDPAIADLRISGAFPISDTQRTLNMLVQTYPVLATGHLSGYWVTLSPA